MEINKYFNIAIHKFCKFDFEKIICYRIPIQTLQFPTTLPTRQDGAENHDKANYVYIYIYIYIYICTYIFTFFMRKSGS